MPLHPRDSDFFFGHTNIVNYLVRQIQNPHKSFMFSGTYGVGKATLAYRFIKYLLSDELEHENVETLSIKKDAKTNSLVSNRAHPDLIVLEPEKTNKISVEQVRNATNKLILRPAISKYNILLIDQAEKLNQNAANALLKILEEPPSHAIIVLICDKVQLLPLTVASRCNQLTFDSLCFEDFFQIVTKLFNGITKEELDDLFSISDGSIGRACDFYQQLELEPENMNKLDIYNALLENLSNNSSYEQVIKSIDLNNIDIYWSLIKTVVPRVLGFLITSQEGISKQNLTKKEIFFLNQLKQHSLINGFLLESFSTTLDIIKQAETLELDKKASTIMLIDILYQQYNALKEAHHE